MIYDPDVHSAGFRDVVVAWLICIAVTATAFAYAEVSPASETEVAQTGSVQEHAQRHTVATTTCEVRKSSAEFPPG